MRPGDRVVAIAFGNKKIERVFVQQIENTIVICTQEEWDKAIRENRQPVGVGFPSWTVQNASKTKSY